MFKKLFGLGKFAGEMAKTKAVDAADDLVGVLVGLDPQGASKTQLRMMREELEKASKTLSEREIVARKELVEAEAAEADYSKYKKATLLLNDKIKNDSTLEGSMGGKLDKMIKQTQKLKGVAEKERREADNATKLSDMLKEVIDAKFAQIQEAEEILNDAQFRIDEQKTVAMQQKAEADIASLKSSNSSFNVAFEKMNEKADSLEAENTSNERLSEMRKSGDLSQDDDIAALLNEAEGIKPDTRESKLADL